MAKSLDGGKTFLVLDDGGRLLQHGRGPARDLDRSEERASTSCAAPTPGLTVSWDQGKTWEYVRTMATALAYWVTADMGHPYYVYTGLQDNDSWGGPSATRGRIGITRHDWFHLTGGDGFQTAVDPTDFHIVYSESAGRRAVAHRSAHRTRAEHSAGRAAGAARRRAAAAGGRRRRASTVAITRGGRRSRRRRWRRCRRWRRWARWRGGAAERAQRAARRHVSLQLEHAGRCCRRTTRTSSGSAATGCSSPTTAAIAGRRAPTSRSRSTAARSTVMGVPGTRAQLSKNDGVTAYSTIIAISESPVAAGVVWAGTDDGNLQVSRDGGATFTKSARTRRACRRARSTATTRTGSRASTRRTSTPATAYVAVDGHRTRRSQAVHLRHARLRPTFQSVAANLPAFGNVQVVREDPKNANLLYAGTEFGLLHLARRAARTGRSS